MINSLKAFQFPTLKESDIAFSTLRTNPTLLALAKEKGFDKPHNPYNKLFNDLFFKGGKLNFKPGLDPAFKEKATRYLKAFMHSFEPRQEEKEAISALILSELVEL